MIYKLPFQAVQAIKAIQTAIEGFEVEIRKCKKKRSLNQNAYYHGVVIKIFSQESGYTTDEVHSLFGEMFLKIPLKDKITYNGQTIDMIVRSTTSLTTIEFENYMTQCRMFAGLQGFYIPEPNEVTEQLLQQLERFRY